MIIRILTILAGAHLLVACSKAPVPDNFVLKTYTVPVAFRGEVENTMNNLFTMGTGSPRKGRAQVLANGKMLIAAPESLQKGVANFVKELKSQKAYQESNIRISLSYIIGKVGAGDHIPEDLESLGPQLESISKNSGINQFQLVEKLQAITQSQKDLEVKGAVIKFRGKATLQENGTNLALVINAPGRRLESDIFLRPGKPIVLGTAGLPQKANFLRTHFEEKVGDFLPDDIDANKVRLFYLVKADILED